MNRFYLFFCIDGDSIADVDMGNKESGTPLLQMMMYAIIQRKPKKIQPDVVTFFIEKGAVLSRVLSNKVCKNTSVLEMAISLTRFDIAEDLVFKHNVDPIYGGDPEMKPIFAEYGQFGTNRFIKIVLKKYEEMQRIQAFIECVYKKDVFSEELRHTVTHVYGRNATHPFLLSHNEKAINYLVAMEDQVLEQRDKFGRTALHLAAEQGDKESVKILLKQ